MIFGAFRKVAGFFFFLNRRVVWDGGGGLFVTPRVKHPATGRALSLVGRVSDIGKKKSHADRLTRRNLTRYQVTTVYLPFTRAIQFIIVALYCCTPGRDVRKLDPSFRRRYRSHRCGCGPAVLSAGGRDPRRGPLSFPNSHEPEPAHPGYTLAQVCPAAPKDTRRYRVRRDDGGRSRGAQGRSGWSRVPERR